MNQRPRAKRSDWKTTPLSAQRARLPIDRVFSTHEVARIEHGIIPVAMEEKWFVFTEDDVVYFFRSWTGSPVYEVKLESMIDGGKRISEAWIAAPHGPPANARSEAQQLSHLIDVLFFGRR